MKNKCTVYHRCASEHVYCGTSSGTLFTDFHYCCITTTFILFGFQFSLIIFLKKNYSLLRIQYWKRFGYISSESTFESVTIGNSWRQTLSPQFSVSCRVVSIDVPSAYTAGDNAPRLITRFNYKRVHETRPCVNFVTPAITSFNLV